MTIKEIKEALLGKHIYYYNGWNGSCDYFKIRHIVKDGTCVCLFPQKGGEPSGVYISVKNIQTLIEKGEFIEHKEIERCYYEDRWRLTDSTDSE